MRGNGGPQGSGGGVGVGWSNHLRKCGALALPGSCSRGVGPAGKPDTRHSESAMTG